MTQEPREPDAERPPEAPGFGEPDETEVPGPLQTEGAAAPAGEPAGDVAGDAAVDAAGEAVGEDGTAPPDELTQARTALAERTLDLQRLQAEYLNYKRRVDRDRALIEQNATYRVLSPIIEVLDTIDRAREHGDLDEGFTAVADQLERVVAGLGLTKFGTPGEPFDPNLHEALSHIGEDPEVAVTTCKVVAKAGYRIGERVLRAAQVLVVDPAAG